jgi:hypothetical protein
LRFIVLDFGFDFGFGFRLRFRFGFRFGFAFRISHRRIFAIRPSRALGRIRHRFLLSRRHLNFHLEFLFRFLLDFRLGLDVLLHLGLKLKRLRRQTRTPSTAPLS